MNEVPPIFFSPDELYVAELKFDDLNIASIEEVSNDYEKLNINETNNQ